MTHQRNYILSAAVAAAFGVTAISAHAGVASALPAKIAANSLKNNSQGVKGNQVTYSTQVPLSNATIYYVYVKLTNGVFSATPNKSHLSSNNGVLNAALTGATGALSKDGTFAVYTLAKTTNVIGVNSTISFTPTGTTASEGGVSGLTALVTGGNVNAQISIGSSKNTTSVLADIDSAAGGNIITFTAPERFFSCPSSAGTACSTSLGFGALGTESTQINVATGSGLSLTGTTWTGQPAPATDIDFGGFYVADIPGVLTRDQMNSWQIATEYTVTPLGATVTGNFSAAAAMFMSSSGTCTVSSNSLTLNTAATTATLAAGTILASGAGQAICMIVNGTSVIPPTQPAINITMSTSGTSYETGAALAFGPANLYNLTQNGGSVIIRTYIPGAVAGYGEFVRIINTGTLAANISVARIDPVTGKTGAAAVVTSVPLAAGGAIIFSSGQIETALGGAFAASDRPRLIFTANTTIQGQNFIGNPDGTLTTLHGTD